MCDLALLGDGAARATRAVPLIVAESEPVQVDRDETFLIEGWRLKPDGTAIAPGFDPEGTVAVYTGPPQLTPIARRVGAGYQVEVRGQVGDPQAVDAPAAVAWLKRQIVFENEPLGEVADEFNRYGHIAIEIDEALRSLPITGVFDAYDVDSFVASLATLNDVVVQKSPTRIRILSRASARQEPLSDAR